MHRWTSLAIVFCSIISLVGCGGCGGGNPTPPKKNGDDHGHSHDVPGPHSGKLFVFGKEEFHGELLMDDASGKVTIYLLDKDMKVNEAAVSSQDTITIETTSKGETQTYELAAVGKTAEKPAVNQFEIVDKVLIGALQTLGGDNTAVIKVTIGDKPYDQKIDFEAHGHDH